MSESPVGWQRTNLSAVAKRITKGSTPTSYGFNYQDQGIAFVKVENLRNGSIESRTIKHFISEDADENQKRSRLQAGDILFSIAGTIGETALVQQEHLPANTNQALAIIRGTFEVFEPRFLQYQLQSQLGREQFNDLKRGGGMNNISLGDLREFSVIVPPLNEQRRIVAKLEKLLTCVNAAQERLETIPRLLQRFRQSIVDSASAGALTVDWRKDRHVKLNQFSEKLGNLAKFIDYRGKTPKKTNEGIPLLTAKNIRPGYLSTEPREYIAESDYDSWMTRGIPNVGDVLITTEAPLGYVVCIDWTFKFAIAQRVICLQFDRNTVLGEYAFLVLQSTEFQSELREKATGTTVSGIKASRLKELSISFPDREEQEEIVRRVEALLNTADALEARYLKAKAYVDKLTESILAKAFRGELVRQDPNDEPASILLERITREANGSSVVKRRPGSKDKATGRQYFHASRRF